LNRICPMVIALTILGPLPLAADIIMFFIDIA